MIHVFHGFLGSPEDFQFISGPLIKLHDLYFMDKLPDVQEDDMLIGYSMGGRIAMELAFKANFKLKKLVLINAHPGLESEEERSERSLFEDKIFERLQNSTQDEFMTWWNSLPLFKSDKAISTTPERFQKSAELFNRYRLSKQHNYLPMLGEYKDKVLFIAGLDDEKYMDLVSEKLIPLDIEIKGIQGGHRLFQKTTELTDLLKEEGIL